MGQKVNPIGFRIGEVTQWPSVWFANKDKYSSAIHSDLKIRKYVKDSLYKSGVSKVFINRYSDELKLQVYCSRPGILIGKSGVELEKVRKFISKIEDSKVSIDIKEVKKPELEATLVAENVALQIEKRVSFRKAVKRAIKMTMRMGALGVKVSVAGRLGGAEIARTEWYKEGRIPLHTIRSNIDYAIARANTTYGVIGIKVWINK